MQCHSWHSSQIGLNSLSSVWKQSVLITAYWQTDKYWPTVTSHRIHRLETGHSICSVGKHIYLQRQLTHDMTAIPMKTAGRPWVIRFYTYTYTLIIDRVFREMETLEGQVEGGAAVTMTINRSWEIPRNSPDTTLLVCGHTSYCSGQAWTQSVEYSQHTHIRNTTPNTTQSMASIVLERLPLKSKSL